MNMVKYIKTKLHNQKVFIGDKVGEVYFNINRNKYDIEKYKNKFYGGTCFVIGNGPSLLSEDLNKIRNSGYVTFASNRIYSIFNSTYWRPTFMGVSDAKFIYNNLILKEIERIQPEALFVRNQFSFLTRNAVCNCIPVKTETTRELLDNPQFSMECDKIIYDIATVTYFNIQLAAYMGFKKIYLVGMDNRYAYSKLRDGTVIRNEGVANYFGEQGITMPDPSKAVDTWELDIAYEYAEKYSREHGFRIYNATRGGFLEKFERVNLDDILKGNQE